jgi:multidrug efflux pump subunit AcrB
LVSALSISIVFAPVVLLRGTAKYLFQPLAMAVVFAMLASYLWSRTLICRPWLRYLLDPAARCTRGGQGDDRAAARDRSGAHARGVSCEGFERLRAGIPTVPCYVLRSAGAGLVLSRCTP